MESLRLAILVACRHMLIPWVTFLIRFGIGYREFAEVSKKVFVDIAAKDFGVRGRRTNTSRIAVLTGIPRKQVKQVLELEGIGEFGATQMTQASLVLAAWFSDESFLDEYGNPRTIEFDRGSGSFTDLARRYGRDIPAGALLKELIRTGAVEKCADGKLIARSKTNIAQGSDIESIKRAGAILHHMVSTVVNNLMAENQSQLRLERRSFSINVPLKRAKKFRSFVESEGQRFVERVDEWITDNEVAPDDAKLTYLLGAGVYMFEDKNASIA